MSYLDKNQLAKIWKILSNGTTREIVIKMNKKQTMTYSEIAEIVMKGKKSRSATAFYVRKLFGCKVIKKEKDKYFLTRTGLESVKVINHFEKICMTFDLSDVDKDGKLQTIVVRY